MRILLLALVLLGLTIFSSHAAYQAVLHHQAINNAQRAASLSTPYPGYRHLDWPAVFE